MSEQQPGTSTRTPAQSAAWDRIERARHPQRPYPMEFIERIFTDFSEIHGDRAYGDDEAVACGMARLNGDEVLVIDHGSTDGTQKAAEEHGAAVKAAIPGVDRGAYVLDLKNDWVFCLCANEVGSRPRLDPGSRPPSRRFCRARLQ